MNQIRSEIDIKVRFIVTMNCLHGPEDAGDADVGFDGHRDLDAVPGHLRHGADHDALELKWRELS